VAACIGLQGGQIQFHSLDNLPRLMDLEQQRPQAQWWLDVRPIANLLAQPAPQG